MKPNVEIQRSAQPSDGMAANTHRALKQDEVKVTTELLEDVLASDNLVQAWKRVNT